LGQFFNANYQAFMNNPALTEQNTWEWMARFFPTYAVPHVTKLIDALPDNEESNRIAQRLKANQNALKERIKKSEIV
jgi:hypothetical protein